MFDIIGDIHGHCDELEALLIKLGYTVKNGIYSHPVRNVIFVGDYIDRGPQIREVLHIVKKMTETGNAIALMGNHEYNAICFNYQQKEGGYLRKHLIKNITQHYETLNQFMGFQKEYDDYIEWFKTLPLFYEAEKFRVVHACWDNIHINYLKEQLDDNRLTNDLIYLSTIKGSKLNKAIDDTLNGKRIKLPDRFEITTKDGRKRTKIRAKWWENTQIDIDYCKISIELIENLPNLIIDKSILFKNHYKETEKPVFFGHYWLDGELSLFKNNICCLDYSVAKSGKLVAYKYDLENDLSSQKFVSINSNN